MFYYGNSTPNTKLISVFINNMTFTAELNTFRQYNNTTKKNSPVFPKHCVYKTGQFTKNSSS